MRITVVTETYAPQLNGVSRTLGHLVRVFRAGGDRVQVVHPDYGPAPDGPDDLVVRSEQVPFYSELRVPIPPFSRIYREVEEFRPDIVHIATEASLGLGMLRFARGAGIPVVSSFHTNFDQYTGHYGVGWLTGLVWRYLRWFHNNTAETYVPSRDTIGRLAQRGFERLRLWPRGVDAQLFRPCRPGRTSVREALGFRDDQIVVGHVSRIAVEKNVEYLTAALRRLVEQEGDRVGILIVGDGPARAEMEERLGRSACWVGYKRGDELADHYAACDVFAFASRTETFGNVVLEAMASGLPVVALRSGGPAETIKDGDTGLLIDPDAAPEAMSAALASLVEEDECRDRMSRAARGYAESQSWDVIMRQLRECYAACVARSGARARVTVS